MARQTRLIQNQLELKTGTFDSSSSTKFSKAIFRHKWSIDDFEDYCDLKGTKIASSIFSDGTIDGLKWRLEINSVVCYNNDMYGYLNLDLCLILNNFDNLKAKCELSILNNKLEQTNKVKQYVQFTRSKLNQNFYKFFNKKKLTNPENSYLLNGKLTILCEIIILGNDISSQFAIPHDLGLLLSENPDYTIITFSVLGKELRALKIALVANSAVFAAMLSHEFNENKVNRIEIVDIEYEVLQNMLVYLYTKKINNLETMADRLLIAADKYELQHLKQRCVEWMSKNVSITNAAQYYVLADLHNVEELKQQVKKFIMNNPKDVQLSAGFILHFSQYPELFEPLRLPKLNAT